MVISSNYKYNVNGSNSKNTLILIQFYKNNLELRNNGLIKS